MSPFVLGSSDVQMIGFEDVAVVEQCPIYCASESSVCRKGTRTPSLVDSLWLPPVAARAFAPDTDDDPYHCLCQIGFTGVDCSVPVESCPIPQKDQQAASSNKLAVCLHGGTCREGGGCDCTTAARNGTQYTGQNCEMEVPMESYCSSASSVQSSSKNYCLNGGTCSPTQDAECTCPSGFEGEHCELQSDPLLSSECSLPCRNQGVCVVGSSSEASRRTAGVLFTDIDLDGMHCQCPEGYAGALCQYQLRHCGGENDTVCLHGSQCVESTSKGESADAARYRCECEDPDDPVCNKKVDYCTPDAGHVEYYESMAVPAFCVNGGKCEDVATGPLVQYRCICPELFHGRHCELLKNGRDILNEFRAAEAAAAWEASQEALDLRRRGLMSLYILLAALLLTAVAWYCRLRWRVRRSTRRNNNTHFNKNLYGFRDENVGVTTANGNMMFPTFYTTGGGNRREEDEQHLILHDVELT